MGEFLDDCSVVSPDTTYGRPHKSEDATTDMR